MTVMQTPDKAKSPSSALAKAKPMLAGVLGAIIGCGASLHIYYTLLGGAEQNQRLAQVESTVEHNRVVGEQTLVLVTQMHRQTADAKDQRGAALSQQPTQRELSDALDGLFVKLPEAGDSDAAAPAAAQPNEPTASAAPDAHKDVQDKAKAEK